MHGCAFICIHLCRELRSLRTLVEGFERFPFPVYMYTLESSHTRRRIKRRKRKARKDRRSSSSSYIVTAFGGGGGCASNATSTVSALPSPRDDVRLPAVVHPSLCAACKFLLRSDWPCAFTIFVFLLSPLRVGAERTGARLQFCRSPLLCALAGVSGR